MDDTREEIFCDLMELPPGERVQALESMEGVADGDRVQILQMLAEAEKAEAYFTGTSFAVKMLPEASHLETEGDMCGPYQLVRKLGEGGFGLVWLAVQEMPLKRTVAVKVIKATEAGELLPRSFAQADHFECRFCSYAERCWGGAQ